MTTPYNKRDHTHCPPVDSPCGLKGEHRCCLCEEPVQEQPKESIVENIYFAFLVLVAVSGIVLATVLITRQYDRENLTYECTYIDKKLVIVAIPGGREANLATPCDIAFEQKFMDIRMEAIKPYEEALNRVTNILTKP